MENAAPTPQPTIPEMPKKFPMKTVVLIGVLAVIAAVLIYFAFQLNGSQPAQAPATDTATQVSPTTMVEKTATISFSPSNLDLTTSTSATVDIITTAGNTPITSTQAYIKYDPAVIKNVKILPPDSTTSLFGPTGSYLNLFSENDTENGMLKFGIGIQPTGNPVVGTGSIGKLSFTVVKSAPSTQITFADGTAVATNGIQESVLNYTTPLTITLQ